MKGKCKFQMALNHLKIDYFEKNWGDRELNVLKKYFGTFQLNSFWGAHLPCHVTSPTIYSKHSQTKIC